MDEGQDYLLRAVAAGGKIRILAARTTKTTETARRRHQTLPVATAALGRSLTATLLLSALTTKGKERLTLRILGDGPLRAIVADADASGHVRGYVKEPRVSLPASPLGKLDVGRAVGRGELVVSRDLEGGGVYTSSVPLKTGEIGDDVAHYLDASDQIPSAVGLGVRVSAKEMVTGAGGWILQVLPGGEDVLGEVEAAITAMPPVSALMTEGKSPEDAVRLLTPGLDPTFLEARPVAFRCTCSRGRSRRALLGLGREDLRNLLETAGVAEIRCHFCAKVYRFTKEAFKELAAPHLE